MQQLLNKLHARLGDFWWYSLMIFMAARAADCLNVFVGLWLVPKYVPPSELGAVQPLTNFASLLPLHNISKFQTLMYWMTGATLVRLPCCFVHAGITRGLSHDN